MKICESILTWVRHSILSLRDRDGDSLRIKDRSERIPQNNSVNSYPRCVSPLLQVCGVHRGTAQHDPPRPIRA